MTELRITTSFVDGSTDERAFDSGKQLIETILGDEFAAAPRYITLHATDQTGKPVSITIQYDQSCVLRVS